MKTKNFLLTGALLIVALFSVNGVMAETPVDLIKYNGNRVSTDAVTVNIKFTAIQSIQVNPNQQTINFEYNTPDHYTYGLVAEEKTQTKTDHLTVYHSGPFNVKVKSSGFLNGTEVLEGTDHVKVLARIGANSNIKEVAGLGFHEVSLAANATGTEFITSQKGGMGYTFDVKYDHSGDHYKDYINNNYKSEDKTYTATVTYEISSN